MGGEFLDHAEYVIPATGIQAGCMLTQLKEYFLHFEGGQNCFNENGGANCAAGNFQMILSELEDIVPQPRFQMAFHFG